MPRSKQEETYCIYCQHEYVTHAKLVRHIRAKHAGTYAYYSIAGGDKEGD